MIQPTAPVSVTSPAHQSAIRLLCMVHELHRAGYQHVRFSSGMAPNGMQWRCSITHAGNMSDDGLRVVDYLLNGDVASYSTGSQDRYFDWPDVPGRSSKELATLFVERFPRIVQIGKGRDWAYAGWLTEVIGRAERGGSSSLPVFFADYPLDIDPIHMPPPVRTRTRWQRAWEAVRCTRRI